MTKQEKLGWGKAIVETLAKDLQKEFPGIQGFSARNLWNMRTFYLTYKAVPEKYRHQAKLAVKDEYPFDFLELGEEHSEKELERALLENVRKFLLEMGGYFNLCGQSIPSGDRWAGVFRRSVVVSPATAVPCCDRIKGKGMNWIR